MPARFGYSSGGCSRVGVPAPARGFVYLRISFLITFLMYSDTLESVSSFHMISASVLRLNLTVILTVFSLSHFVFAWLSGTLASFLVRFGGACAPPCCYSFPVSAGEGSKVGAYSGFPVSTQIVKFTIWVSSQPALRNPSSSLATSVIVIAVVSFLRISAVGVFPQRITNSTMGLTDLSSASFKKIS